MKETQSMGKIKGVELTKEERNALEKGCSEGKTTSFRQRCQMILFKSERLTSQEIAQRLGCCEAAINHWLRRYQRDGIEGLKNRPGQSRKMILDRKVGREKVQLVLQTHKKNLYMAQAELETVLGKQFSTMTLKRFVKRIQQDAEHQQIAQ
jgi:transposase